MFWMHGCTKTENWEKFGDRLRFLQLRRSCSALFCSRCSHNVCSICNHRNWEKMCQTRLLPALARPNKVLRAGSRHLRVRLGVWRVQQRPPACGAQHPHDHRKTGEIDRDESRREAKRIQRPPCQLVCGVGADEAERCLLRGGIGWSRARSFASTAASERYLPIEESACHRQGGGLATGGRENAGRAGFG